MSFPNRSQVSCELTWKDLKCSLSLALKVLPHGLGNEEVMRCFLIRQQVFSMRTDWSIEMVVELSEISI